VVTPHRAITPRVHNKYVWVRNIVELYKRKDKKRFGDCLKSSKISIRKKLKITKSQVLLICRIQNNAIPTLRKNCVMIELSNIQSKIYEVRGCKVMLDVDLAQMYQVETRVLNQSVSRNIKRFPPDFMFQLTKQEFVILISQFVTSSWGGIRKLPYAFTEQGVAMLSGLLNSDVAISVNIIIMRAFVAIRQLILHPPVNEVRVLQHEVKELKQYIDEVFTDYNDINQDTRMQLELIHEALAELQVKNREPDTPRRLIGFRRSADVD